jgi:sarcosine oxidase subunit alpha
MMSDRLETSSGVDLAKPIRFRFNGKPYGGFVGDTLASALLANGVRVIGRSFKYHRPRGIVSAGVEEPNALVQLVGQADEANVLATVLPLVDGLEARSVNCWPGPAFDIAASLGLFSRLLPAGFYYKTFMWPASLWPKYEHVIRKMAGLGRAPSTGSSMVYRRRYDHCDVLIVGAGPAGLSAARIAAATGARVMLVDENQNPGGSLASDPIEIDGKRASDWASDECASFDAAENTTRLMNATAWGYYDHNMIGILERHDDPARRQVRLVRARQVIVATGAIERPLVFPDNDRPGVLLAASVMHYAQRYGVTVGRQPAFFTNNDSAYETAVSLHQLGVQTQIIADTRGSPTEAGRAMAASIGAEIVAGANVVGVQSGRSGVTAVTLETGVGERRRVECDVVGISGGWTPTVHLFSQSGGQLRFNDVTQAFVPDACSQQVQCAGAANGSFSLATCFAEGADAAMQALEELKLDVPEMAVPESVPGPDYAIEPHQPRPANGGKSIRGKAFVDFANDVTAADLRLAMREGYRSVEHLKRYTTTGMGPDQGKLANTNAIGLMATEMKLAPGEVGTTTFRPPYRPIEFGAIAGQDSGALIRPVRETPMTGLHIAANAVMYESGGGWRRPGYYPKPGEKMSDAINRETLAVREGVGIYDSSPLGKFELRGPDTAEFLNRLYTNGWSKLEFGRGRYGVMLGDDGGIFDDGVTFRLDEHHYLMTTTTGGAGAVHSHMERLLQCEWPDLRVLVTPVTTQWANAVICGPLARTVLEQATTDIDLDPMAFQFMDIRHGTVAGMPARVARVSFRH